MEKNLYPLRGIVTVLNTPFTMTGEVDYISLKKNIIEALKAGVNGFLVPAMASEINNLTHKERLKIVETTLIFSDGKVPVFAGLSETNFSRSIELLKSYLKLGCKQILFQIPFTNENQFKYKFSKLAELQPEVIMLQDWDQTGYGLPDHLIVDLFEQTDSFRCIKIETIPASVKYSKLIKLTNNQLSISGGWAVTQMIEGLMRGIHAFMPTGMHWIYSEIFNLWMNGKTLDAASLFNKVLPSLAFSNQHIDISIQFFKRLLNRQGIYSTSTTRPLEYSFDSIHEQISKDHMNTIIKIEEEIKHKNFREKI
ncbi:MAG: dihydrodipicolinate synthase family protein [bacterium]